MTCYTRMALAEREETSRALAANHSLRTIARQLGRPPQRWSPEQIAQRLPVEYPDDALLA